MTTEKRTKRTAGRKTSSSRWRKILALVAAAALVWFYAYFDTAQLKYMRWDIGPKVIDIAKAQGVDGFTDISAKQEVHPDYSPKDSYCFLVFGQSNVANSSNAVYEPKNELYTVYKGKIYKATNPLPGADGVGSNPMLEALDLFASNHPDKKIFILPIAISGSSVFHWAKTGELHDKLVQAVGEAKKLGLPITHVIYHQGEADCAIETPPGYYKTALKSVLGDVRALGVTAPIFLGQASLHKSFTCDDIANPDCYIQCPKLVEAQAELSREMENVHPGVNSDKVVGWSNRHDGYHFNAQGDTLFAKEMDRILEEYTAKTR